MPDCETERDILLSVQPRYGTLILDGSKTVELRRSRMRVAAGSRVLLYHSTPVRAVVGSAVVASIDSGSADELWDRVGEFCGVTREVYDEYFAGADTAYGVFLTDPQTLEQPVPLTRLRELRLEPAQSFRYVSPDQAAALHAPSTTAGSDVEALPRQTHRGWLARMLPLRRPSTERAPSI